MSTRGLLEMASKTIICGSPKESGKTLFLAQTLFDASVAENPDDVCTLITLSDMDIEGCVGCDGCKETFSCVIDDDMQEVYEFINDSDDIVVVSPIYMAGVPARLKALLDRLQPYFWSGQRHEKLRPASLHLVGEGNDPFGSDGAALCVKSALLVAGFEVKNVEVCID